MADPVVNTKKLSYQERILNIVRKYHAYGLINDNNEAAKRNINALHRTKPRELYNIALRYVLPNLVKRKVILHPNESGKPNLIVFKPSKLKLILTGRDENENKLIVFQNLASEIKNLKEKKLNCSVCCKTFSSQLSWTLHDTEECKLIANLRKQAEKLESFKKRTDVYAEVLQGAGSYSETIFNERTSFQTNLILVNQSTSAITLNDIESVNSTLSPYMNIAYERVVIPAKDMYNIQLNLRFESKRSYTMPLIITYIKPDNSVDGFLKVLVFEILPKNLQVLLPSFPYKKPHSNITNMNEIEIICGEKPKVENVHKFAIDLKSYELTSEFIRIFRSRLKTGPIDASDKNLYFKIKQLLDVEDPINCLSSKNYRNMLDLLLYLEEYQMNIDIKNYNTTTDQLTHVSGNLYKLIVSELSENRPSLIMGDSVFVNVPGSDIKYEGIVHEKSIDNVKLGFSYKFASVYVKKMKFDVSFGFNRTTLKLEHQAAQLAANCAKYFFPEEISPSEQADLTINCFNKNINDNEQQLQAVREIVKGSASSVPYLIFGPPGTGKTMTVVEAILQVRKLDKNKRILISASSNSAANNICERLLEFSSFSRNEMHRYLSYNCNLSDLSAKLSSYCNIYNGMVCQPSISTLKTFKLVITTLTTAGRLYNGGILNDHFHYVFIDEAGHATESETLIPITAALVNHDKVNGRVILAGDPEQLGPITHSSIAKEYGFGKSMLERLMTTNPVYMKRNGSYDNRVLTKLLKNYRSHPEIIALSNEICYDGELISVGNELSNIALGQAILPNKKFPIIFHSVFGHDDRESNSPSFFNVQEISVVFQYLNKLIGCKMSGYKVAASDIAVVTPYRKQVQKLRQMCGRDPKFDKLEIGSVEKLQGQERLIVIISTVRAKPEYVKHDVKFHLGFLKNKKRMNVALTRAIALLIVIGNPNLLKYDENWRKFIQRCVDNNATTGAPFSMDLDEDKDLLEYFQNIETEDDINFGRGNH